MFKCKFCKKYFARGRNLKQHIKTVHEFRDCTETKEGMFKCDSCEKCFAGSINLKHHIKAVHDEIFSCQFSQCIFTSSKKEDISVHTDSKHAGEEPPNQCHMCNRTFSQKPSLKRHTRNIHGTAVDLKKREI